MHSLCLPIVFIAIVLQALNESIHDGLIAIPVQAIVDIRDNDYVRVDEQARI
jgi:hypothetical protein